MKSKNAVPQFEFGFSGDSFALVGEKAATQATGPTILAEMTEAERERVREQSRAFAAELAREIDAQPSEVTQPGLASGSVWHKWQPKREMNQAMRKAVATGC